MTTPATTTKILEDGLRYKSKAPGSPFGSAAFTGSNTMSCFLCGKHRLRKLLGTKKILGRSEAVCSPSCKEVDKIIAGG